MKKLSVLALIASFAAHAGSDTAYRISNNNEITGSYVNNYYRTESEHYTEYEQDGSYCGYHSEQESYTCTIPVVATNTLSIDSSLLNEAFSEMGISEDFDADNADKRGPHGGAPSGGGNNGGHGGGFNPPNNGGGHSGGGNPPAGNNGGHIGNGNHGSTPMPPSNGHNNGGWDNNHGGGNPPAPPVHNNPPAPPAHNNPPSPPTHNNPPTPPSHGGGSFPPSGGNNGGGHNGGPVEPPHGGNGGNNNGHDNNGGWDNNHGNNNGGAHNGGPVEPPHGGTGGNNGGHNNGHGNNGDWDNNHGGGNHNDNDHHDNGPQYITTTCYRTVEVANSCSVPKVRYYQVLDHTETVRYKIIVDASAKLYSGEKEEFTVTGAKDYPQISVENSFYDYKVSTSHTEGYDAVFTLYAGQRKLVQAPNTIYMRQIERPKGSNDLRISFTDGGTADFKDGVLSFEIIKRGIFSNSTIARFDVKTDKPETSFLLSQYGVSVPDGKYIIRVNLDRRSPIYTRDLLKIMDEKYKVTSDSIQSQSQGQ